MEYTIELTATAEQELRAQFEWIFNRSESRAQQWLTEFQESLQSLSQFPYRCPLAAESILFPSDVRQFLFGRRTRNSRVLYCIENERVIILHIRHGSQDYLKEEDVEN